MPKGNFQKMSFRPWRSIGSFAFSSLSCLKKLDRRVVNESELDIADEIFTASGAQVERT